MEARAKHDAWMARGRQLTLDPETAQNVAREEYLQLARTLGWLEDDTQAPVRVRPKEQTGMVNVSMLAVETVSNEM